jgi:hypothetical protein
MGWVNYSTFNSRLFFVDSYWLSTVDDVRSLFEDDKLVRFFIIDLDIKKCYIIKEQNNKNLYKFIICDYSVKKPKFKNIEFNSNIELLKLIIEYGACNTHYQRHFNINKILNK